MLTPPDITDSRPGASPPAPDRQDERGAIVMSMLVLMIIGLLAASMFAYSQSSARGAMRREVQRSVTDGLDGAMANAMSRIELGESASFSGSGAIGNVQYTYTATKNATLAWTVAATATRTTTASGTVQQAASAAVTGTYAGSSPYALFTSSALAISNNNFSLSQPIGSNGAVAVSGNASSLAIHTFVPSGSCSGCTNASSQSPTWPTPQPTTPTNGRACPVATLIESNGRQSRVYGFLGTLDGKNGQPYRCTFRTDNTVFGHYPTIIYETINIINPPLVIHVDTQVIVWFLRANVNPGGDPRDFTVEAVGGPTDANGYQYGRLWDDGTKLTGVINAPARDLVVQTGVDVTGRMTLGSLTFTANSLKVTADPRVVDASINWTSSAWHAVAP